MYLCVCVCGCRFRWQRLVSCGWWGNTALSSPKWVQTSSEKPPRTLWTRYTHSSTIPHLPRHFCFFPPPSPLFLLLSLLLFFSLIRSFVPFLLPLPPLSSPSPSLHLSPSSPSPQKSDIVKLQTVNLAAKLVLSNPKQTRLLCDYVLSLAKYDQNYDIRDRARFLKQLVTPSEVGKISDGGIFASSPLFLWARTFV